MPTIFSASTPKLVQSGKTYLRDVIRGPASALLQDFKVPTSIPASFPTRARIQSFAHFIPAPVRANKLYCPPPPGVPQVHSKLKYRLVANPSSESSVYSDTGTKPGTLRWTNGTALSVLQEIRGGGQVCTSLRISNQNLL